MGRVAALIAWVVALLTAAGGTPSARQGRVDYRAQIAPIVKRACLECHSQDRRKGGLSLATYSDALDGGRNGAIIRPGNGAGSAVIHRLTGALDPQMPKDEDPLPPAEIALIRLWIDQGARETPDGPPAPAPWEAPMELPRTALPPIMWRGWASPIDRVVSHYLAARRVQEAQSVSDAIYARRVYFDLWGLPPSPSQLATFVNDRAPGKRGALVASLLGDPAKY